MARKSNDQIKAEKELALFGKNYATNESVASRAYQLATEYIHSAKTARKNKEAEWLEDLRLWACQNSDAQMYIGRSNLIVPELHNQVESTVGQFQSGLFPNDDYLGCIPTKNTKIEESIQIKEAVFHELDHKNDLPSLSERYNRQKALYGTAFLKPVFEKMMKSVVLKNEKGYDEVRVVPQFQGVKVNCMDTFHTYVYPETANSVDEALCTFDEAFIPLRLLKQNEKYKNTADIHEVHQDFGDYGWVDTIRMNIANLASSNAYRNKAVLVTELWLDFDIIPGEFVPCVISLANYNNVIEVRRNPFWHQSKPHLMGRYMKGPSGEVYGHSLPERLRSLQYMITDLGNQTMDSLTYTLNPIAIIDPGVAGDVNSFKMQPGARWFANPQGISFQTFPDISQSGFQGMQQVRQMIQQFSDLAPSTAPQLSGKVRSATQASAVQNEISQNLKNMIRSDEADVFSPLAARTHWLLKQFQTEEYQIVTQGVEKGQWITKTVNPLTLHKDCIFVWKGSEVAQKSAIRNQQLLSAFNMAVQMEQVMPGKVELPELYKRVMNDAFDLKDLNIFIDDKQKLTVDPKIENISLSAGEDCEVNPGDEYGEHMLAHRQGFEEAETTEAKLAFIQHMETHDLKKKAQDLIKQQQAAIQSKQMQLASPEQGGGGGRPQQFANPGNPTQAPNSVAQITQGMRGIEPNQGV
jgi:hypothetical protein